MPNITVYVMTVWHDLPNKSSALQASNLNHIEQGIKTVTDFINTLDTNSGAYLYLSQTPFTNALKTKLDGIEAQANKYVLPVATTSALGGVKIDGTTITIDNNGVIHAAESATALSALTDVNLTNLQDGQILKWDNTNEVWVNSSEAEVRTQLALLEDVDITNPQNGDGLFYNSTTEQWENGPVTSGEVLDYNETLAALGDASQTVPSIPVVYSTNEQKIGVWVDERPLYEKTFIVEYDPVQNISNGTEITLDAAFSNMTLYDNLIRYPISCYANSGVDNFMTEKQILIQQTSYQSKGLYLVANTALNGVSKIITTVRYTKSTDLNP